MTKETLVEIKRAMNYHDGDECCGNCQHYENEGQCGIQTFLIPVNSRGWCKHGTHVPLNVACQDKSC